MMNPARIFNYILGFGCVLLIGAGEGAGRTSQAADPAPQPATIVAMGDSLTEGLGVAEDRAYPAQLEALLRAKGYPVRVVNAGISGETSSGARARFEWVLTLEPDIVILETGANDGLRGLDPQLIRDNIRWLVDAFLDRDIVVVLAGMRIVTNMGPSYSRAFAEIYPDIARETKVILIPFFLKGVGGAPHLNQADGIHPTAEGYRVIAEHILPYIVEAIDRHRTRRTEPGQRLPGQD
jgi:acyl-CoA thioesterase-1